MFKKRTPVEDDDIGAPLTSFMEIEGMVVDTTDGCEVKIHPRWKKFRVEITDSVFIGEPFVIESEPDDEVEEI